MVLDISNLEPRQAHDLLTSSVIPRPIAWVSTINKNGKANLAPFSFFTGVSWSPPILAFSVVNRADGTIKDTLKNIRTIPEFVIHIVSFELFHAMELSAKQIPYGEDDSIIRDIHLIPSKSIRPYRIKEAKICFECTLEKTVSLSDDANAGNLILGRVQLAHINDDLLVNGREIDWRRLDAVGRLSGSRYCNLYSVFESETN